MIGTRHTIDDAVLWNRVQSLDMEKMENQNSPFSVRKPDGWEQIVSWTPGSVCPPKEEVWRCLDEYLDNMKLENCDMNEEVVNYAFRRQPSSVRAQDFEIYDFEETKRPYSGLR